MNKLFERLMGEATHLTNQGQLLAATEAIQRALRGSAPLAAAATATVAQDPGDGMVLEGVTRFVDDADAGPEAETETETETDEPSTRAATPESWTLANFTHQGRTLAYRLYVPPSSAAQVGIARPLVVMLHGCTQSAADFAAGTHMNALARDAGVLVLYPEQAQRANAQRCWNWFKPQHQQRGRGEPGVLAALTQSVVDRYQIDPDRVYVAGLSAGGAMADVLGHCYPDLFAAVGVHSGLPHGSAHDVMSAMARMGQGGGAPTATAASPTPPVIVFHGDADATVHPANGEAVVRAARAAGSNAAPTRIEGRSAAGQRHTRTVSPAVGGRGTVEHWVLHGAGHAWSGGSAEGSYTDPRGVDASAEMLRFFLAHPRPPKAS